MELSRNVEQKENVSVLPLSKVVDEPWLAISNPLADLKNCMCHRGRLWKKTCMSHWVVELMARLLSCHAVLLVWVLVSCKKRSTPVVDFQFHAMSGDVPAQKVCRREDLSFPECQQQTRSHFFATDLLKCIICQTDQKQRKNRPVHEPPVRCTWHCMPTTLLNGSCL